MPLDNHARRQRKRASLNFFGEKEQDMRLALSRIGDNSRLLLISPSSLPNGIFLFFCLRTILEDIQWMLAGKYGACGTFTEKRANRDVLEGSLEDQFFYLQASASHLTPNRHLCTSQNRRNPLKNLRSKKKTNSTSQEQQMNRCYHSLSFGILPPRIEGATSR